MYKNPITYEHLMELVDKIEQNQLTIPKDKMLVTGNDEVIDLMRQQGWKGEYHYSPYLENSQVFIVNRDDYKIKLNF